jgi:hypothetical protein
MVSAPGSRGVIGLKETNDDSSPNAAEWMIACREEWEQAGEQVRGETEKRKKAKEDPLVAPSHPPSPSEQRLSPKAYVPELKTRRLRIVLNRLVKRTIGCVRKMSNKLAARIMRGFSLPRPARKSGE